MKRSKEGRKIYPYTRVLTFKSTCKAKGSKKKGLLLERSTAGAAPKRGTPNWLHKSGALGSHKSLIVAFRELGRKGKGGLKKNSFKTIEERITLRKDSLRMAGEK